jgi:hypothetical protein
MVVQFTVNTYVHHIRLNNFWIDLASENDALEDEYV